MSQNSAPFIPALKYSFLTSLFDPVLRWTLRDKVFKGALIDQARMESEFSVLDVGCGTGTLLTELKKRYPSCTAYGLDGDPRILALAERNAESAGAELQLDRAMSFEMPYENESFDRVFSSLFFHHLTRSSKELTLKEIRRVLKPGGELHIADWGEPTNFLMRLAILQVQLLDGFETTRDNVLGLLPQIAESVGFMRSRPESYLSTLFGTLTLYAFTNEA